MIIDFSCYHKVGDDYGVFRRPFNCYVMFRCVTINMFVNI